MTEKAEAELKEVLEAVEEWLTTLLQLALRAEALNQPELEEKLADRRNDLIAAMVELAKVT